MAKHVVANTVKEIRIRAGLTQQSLANTIGVSRQTIVAIEGDRYTPSVALALKLAEVLGEPVEGLFTST